MKEHAKKALKHDTKVLGKTVPTMIIIGLFLVGGGSAALLTSFGTVSGTAEVDQAVTLDTQSNEVKTVTYSFDGTQTAGETEVETHTLYNNADVSATVDFSTECDKGDDDTDAVTSTSEDIDWTGECEGVDTTYAEYFDDAGHDFSGYSSPASGDAQVVVSDGEDLQKKISEATDGDTVLVESSTYSGTIDVTTPNLLIVAENAPDSGSESVVSGAKKGFRVTANGVTIKGFEVTAHPGTLTPNARGIDVQAKDVTVKSNYIHDVYAEDRPFGIFIWGDNSNVDNVEISNNRVKNVQATVLTGTDKGESKVKGIALDGDNDNQGEQYTASGVDISYNTVQNIGGNGDAAMASAINIYGGSPVDFDVKYNQISGVDHNEHTTAFSGSYKHPYAQGVYLSGLTKNVDRYSGVGTSNIAYNNFEMSADAVVDAQFADYTNNHDYSFSNAVNYWGTDGIEVIDESSDISGQYSWKTKSDLTVEAGTSDEFGAVNDFAINLAPDSYSLNTEIVPVTS